MVSRKYFGLVMGTWLMLAMAIVMAVVVQIITTGKVVFMVSVIMAAEAFAINFIAGLIIPAPKFGDSFAARCGASERTFRFMAISTFIVAAIYVTIVSFVMTIISVGFSPILIPAWLSVYPYVFILGYVIAVAFTPVALKLTMLMVKEE